MTDALSTETQAVLLLCGRLGQSTDAEPRPLGPRQYDALAAALETENLSPADLLDEEGRHRFTKIAIPEAPAERVLPLLERGAALALMAERWQRSAIWVLSRNDAAYPDRLRRYLGRSTPPLLYGLGDVKLLAKGGLSIVGSRDRGDADAAFAHRAGAQCAAEGITVISGAARGIDRDAMSGALENGGCAVGLIPEGLDKYTNSADLRDYIADGRLVLASALDPSAAWSTAAAMERNRFLYALGDAALVVACEEGEGGTWAGASAALREQKTRVFVRLDAAAPLGNRRLHSLGATPFPAEPWSNFADLLAPPPATSDAFTLILPELLRLTAQPCDEKTLAEKLGVRLPQMKDWLNRAVEERRLDRLKRPARYVASARPLSLFED